MIDQQSIHAARNLHCKNIRISMDILWPVIRILTQPVPCTFVSVDRRNSEALAHIAIWKTRLEISVDIRIAFTVCVA